MKHRTFLGLDHEHRLIEFFVMLDRKPSRFVAAFSLPSLIPLHGFGLFGKPKDLSYANISKRWFFNA